MPVDSPSKAVQSQSWIYIIGNLLVWLGHFFLLGFPVLFVLFHLLFYRGGGTSGVPLGLSLFMAPFFYVPGFLLRAMGARNAA